jgi:hypothetical protein
MNGERHSFMMSENWSEIVRNAFFCRWECMSIFLSVLIRHFERLAACSTFLNREDPTPLGARCSALLHVGIRSVMLLCSLCWMYCLCCTQRRALGQGLDRSMNQGTDPSGAQSKRQGPPGANVLTHSSGNMTQQPFVPMAILRRSKSCRDDPTSRLFAVEQLDAGPAVPGRRRELDVEPRPKEGDECAADGDPVRQSAQNGIVDGLVGEPPTRLEDLSESGGGRVDALVGGGG